MTEQDFIKFADGVRIHRQRISQLEKILELNYKRVTFDFFEIEPGIFWDIFTPNSIRLEQLIINEKEELNNLLNEYRRF